jgi:hypothetical protein
MLVSSGEKEGGILEAADVDPVNLDDFVSGKKLRGRRRRSCGHVVNDDGTLNPANRKIEAVKAADGPYQRPARHHHGGESYHGEEDATAEHVLSIGSAP